MDTNGLKELIISTTKPNDGESHELKDANTFHQGRVSYILK